MDKQPGGSEKILGEMATGTGMLFDNPFLYRAFRPGRAGRWRQFVLALAGPLILLLPGQLGQLFDYHFARQESIRLSLFAYVAYLCIRAIGGSVGKISQERERGSWEVLISAGMSPQRIGWGLWLACLVPVCWATTLTLPWLVSNLTHWLALFTLFLGLALFYSSLGLYCSLRQPSSLKAAQLSYGWLALGGAGSFLVWLLGQVGHRSGLSDLILVGNPWALAASFSGQPGLLDWLGLAFHWLGGVALGLAIRRQIYSPARVSASGLAKGRHRLRGEDNPLLYRNQFQRSWRGRLGLALVYGLIVVAPWLSLGEGYDGKSRLVFSLLGHLGFWLLRAVQASSQVLCREREQRTLEALLTTRLSVSEMLRGIWSQTVAPTLRQALWLSPLLLIPLEFRWGDWLLLTLMTQVSIFGWGGLALAFSLGCRTTVRAFQGVYLSLAFLTIGTLALDVSLLDPILHYDGPLLSLVNPLLSLLYVGLNERSASDTLQHCWAWALLFHLALGYFSRAYVRRRLA